MRRVSSKRQRRNSEVKPVRDNLRKEVGKCELCGRFSSVLDVHEISRGVHRQKSLDKLFALLVVCRSCHDDLGSAKQWPEARQLAILAEKRLKDWDLAAYLELTSPRAPKRIELEEVVAYMSENLLKIEQIAERMQVNRRTVQDWIDSGQLPAADLRTEGAQRALWRVQPIDLMQFAQARKKSQREPTVGHA